MISKILENEINENFNIFIKWKKMAYRKEGGKKRMLPPPEIWEKLKLLQAKYPDINLQEHFPVTQAMWNRHVLGIKPSCKKKTTRTTTDKILKKKSDNNKPFVFLGTSEAAKQTNKADHIATATPLLTLELKNGTKITVYQ